MRKKLFRDGRWRLFLAGFAACLLGLVAAAAIADRSFPPPELAKIQVSEMVIDRHGDLLRPYTISNGRWRLAADLKTIDPLFLKMVQTYEDKRFYQHIGIDPLSTLRALSQRVRNGRIISGGSTITMQLARLLEPRQQRSLGAKLKQAARALQLEKRYSKDEILTSYLTLAPYGGNLEGVRAASLAWIGREPKKLSVAESALLVALPQSPEARRPDKFPTAALAARDRVIKRMYLEGVIGREDMNLALAAPLPESRQDFPVLAAHASDEAHAKGLAQLTIDATTQRQVEKLVTEQARQQNAYLSIAVIMADVKSGEVLARVGSNDPFDQRSRGWVDMTKAIRSPGSTLKPFIYGLAFESGIAHPETLVEDEAANFSGYSPRNFNESFNGTISIRKALQMSLNIPAVKTLELVGPLRLGALMNQAGVEFKLPRSTSPTLAMALGGLGLTLRDLVTLYSAFPRQGIPFVLHEYPQDKAAPQKDSGYGILGKNASWYVSDILLGTPAPQGATQLNIGYKTGTSYGYRDAWSVGFDNRYVIGVWVGRADGTAVPDLTGRTDAAPLLFKIFNSLEKGSPVAKPQPPSSVIASVHDLPATLRHIGPVKPAGQKPVNPPEILFPPEGATLALEKSAGGVQDSLVVKLSGGIAPYRLLINDTPQGQAYRSRILTVSAQSKGFTKLTVVDAQGQVATVSIFIQ